MTIEQIKAAVDAGKKVNWGHKAYEVIKDGDGEYLIHYTPTDQYWGLTNRAGDRLNGDAGEFFISEPT